MKLQSSKIPALLLAAIVGASALVPSQASAQEHRHSQDHGGVGVVLQIGGGGGGQFISGGPPQYPVYHPDGFSAPCQSGPPTHPVYHPDGFAVPCQSGPPQFPVYHPDVYSPIPVGGCLRSPQAIIVNNGPGVAVGVNVSNGHVSGGVSVQLKNVGISVGIH